jgi:alanine-synthesizing transaminase
MIFSRRVALAPPNALSALLDDKRRAGARIRDLTVSNPTQVGLVYPGEEILAALADPAALVYQPEPRGLLAAREAVAADYARRGLFVHVNNLLLTASTSEAYALLFKLLCDPGDTVLAPTPSYPLFDYLASLEGISLASYPLAYDGQWHIDFAALDEAPPAKALLFVSPNNPTGSYLKEDEHRRLVAWAAERGMALIVDEVFAEYPAADAPRDRVELAARPGCEALVFSLGGLSKAAGLPQLKLGWIAAAGPEALVAPALGRLELIADSYLSVATPVQLAAGRLLAAGAKVRAQILARVRANRAAVAAAVAGTAVELLPAEGGWSAVLRLPSTRSDEEIALALLRDHHTLVHPGYFFDFARGTYLVLSLLGAPDDVAAGISAIVAGP